MGLGRVRSWGSSQLLTRQAAKVQLTDADTAVSQYTHTHTHTHIDIQAVLFGHEEEELTRGAPSERRALLFVEMKKK